MRDQEKRSVSIPKFTQEQYDYLVQLHPKQEVLPSQTYAEVMYSGGEQNVLATVQRNIGFRPVRLRDER